MMSLPRSISAPLGSTVLTLPETAEPLSCTDTKVVNVDRKTRNIQLSIKQKDMADEQGQMANLSQQSSRENAGTTSLGALLRAKLDNTADKQ